MTDMHLKVLALVLAGIGLLLCVYKVSVLGLPLFPSEQTQVWKVGVRISFDAGRAGGVKAEFYLPRKPPGFSILEEDFVSSNYGLAKENDGINRKALWAVRRAKGKQVLYYNVVLARDPGANRERTSGRPLPPDVPDYPEPEGSAVFALLDDVRSKSADISSFARELLVRFNDPSPDEDISLLRKDSDSDVERVRKITHILAGARVPSRIVYVLRLEDGVRHGTLEPWLEVHNGSEWLAFNPENGERGIPDDVLLWRVGDDPLISVQGGKPAEVNFSIARSSREVVGVAQTRANLLNSRVMEFSLYSLPVQTQNTYRILLLVSIGALVVVLMRSFIGIKTFGTFMPILIALAFRETELMWGIFLFTMIVAIGLLLRFYLDNLKLLLVPRLASVLIIVILLMAGISVFSHKLGLERGLSVALFPMVILAMTIERMSLVWDEYGAKEALQQGIGSLVVAVLGYLAMSNKELGHLVFAFPELLLVMLAFCLIMGRYTGYRLTELWRFREAVKPGRPSS